MITARDLSVERERARFMSAARVNDVQVSLERASEEAKPRKLSDEAAATTIQAHFRGRTARQKSVQSFLMDVGRDVERVVESVVESVVDEWRKQWDFERRRLGLLRSFQVIVIAILLAALAMAFPVAAHSVADNVDFITSDPKLHARAIWNACMVPCICACMQWAWDRVLAASHVMTSQAIGSASKFGKQLGTALTDTTELLQDFLIILTTSLAQGKYIMLDLVTDEYEEEMERYANMLLFFMGIVLYFNMLDGQAAASKFGPLWKCCS